MMRNCGRRFSRCTIGRLNSSKLPAQRGGGLVVGIARAGRCAPRSGCLCRDVLAVGPAGRRRAAGTAHAGGLLALLAAGLGLPSGLGWFEGLGIGLRSVRGLPFVGCPTLTRCSLGGSPSRCWSSPTPRRRRASTAPSLSRLATPSPRSPTRPGTCRAASPSPPTMPTCSSSRRVGRRRRVSAGAVVLRRQDARRPAAVVGGRRAVGLRGRRPADAGRRDDRAKRAGRRRDGVPRLGSGRAGKVGDTMSDFANLLDGGRQLGPLLAGALSGVADPLLLAVIPNGVPVVAGIRETLDAPVRALPGGAIQRRTQSSRRCPTSPGAPSSSSTTASRPGPSPGQRSRRWSRRAWVRPCSPCRSARGRRWPACSTATTTS